MNGKYFLDTNVLVYALDSGERAKRDVARKLIRSASVNGQGMISYQVIQEFCSLATRKFAKAISPDDLRGYLRDVLAPLCEVHSSIELYEACLDVRQQTGYSFYDALVIAAAASGGCDTIFTEDLQDGQTVAGVKIVNPFSGTS